MPRALRLPSVDPFLVWLIVVVATASVAPVRGGAATLVDGLANGAIMLLFFLHGAKLSRAAIMAGVGHWRLHLMVLGSTYLLFPLVGVALGAAAQGWLDPALRTGLLFLCLLPSTVQSSIAFTSIARGNVAAAVCSASLSNLVGIALTPLLVGVLLHPARGQAGGDWQGVAVIVKQLLVPFVLGHALRPVIGGWVDRHKTILTPVDRGSILLVVFSAFSAAVVHGIWRQLGVADLAQMLGISAVLLVVVMAVNMGAARAAGLARGDAIVLLFCGSKKSLVSGVPMAGALFAPAQVGIMVLPLMIFHQLQLFVCAWLAARYAAQPEPAPAAEEVPQGPQAIATRSAQVALPIPRECMAGVEANLALLASHVERMRAGGQ